MGALQSYPSSITAVKSFKELTEYLNKQHLSNSSIQASLKSLTNEANSFFTVYDIVSEKKISGNISPYFIKIDQAINSFYKCAKYIFDHKRSPESKVIKTSFQNDLVSFIKQLISLTKYTATILQIIREKSYPTIFERFYIELSMFEFALTVQNTDKPPYYQLSTLPAYSLHDRLLKTSQKYISVVGPHESGKTTLVPMFLACRSLSKSIKSNFIILVENNPTLVHGIEDCYKRIKKRKRAKVKKDDESDESDGDVEVGDDDDEFSCLVVTSSLQKVVGFAKMKSIMSTVIAILSPLEALQLIRVSKDFAQKAIFIIDDIHERIIETDVLFQDISRYADKFDEKKKIAKITMMSTISDYQFLEEGRYENLELETKIKNPAQKKKITCGNIKEICSRALFKEMRNLFDNWIDDSICAFGSVITFVPNAKAGKRIIKNIYHTYSLENSLKVIPLRTKIRKGEVLEDFNERLSDDIKKAAIERSPDPEAAARNGPSTKNMIFILPIDLTGKITEEQQNLIEYQLPLPFIENKLIRLIVSTNQNEQYLRVPDLKVIFDSGLIESVYYDIKRAVSIYKEELLPLPYINERHNLLGECEDGIHFIFEAKNCKRPKKIIPAVKRCNMAQSILRLRSIDIKLEDQHNLPSEPDHDILDASVEVLEKIGLIDPKTKDLTAIGKVTAKFSSVSPFLALATAKFTDNPEFAFLVSLIIERSSDLVDDNRSPFLCDHFCSESDVVTFLESILALNVDAEGHLIDENAVNIDDSGFSVGSLYSIYTTIANTFEKDGRNEGRETVVAAIQWARGQPGGTIAMVDKYVNFLDQDNFINTRKASFNYVVGAGPGCEPQLIYKGHDILKFEDDKEAQIRLARRPGWLGLQCPGDVIFLSFQIEESISLNRGLLIHRDPTKVGVNPGVSSQEETNPSLNSYFFTALFEAYWSGQPTANNFGPIYYTYEIDKKTAFLINISEVNKRTFINYCPKNAGVKNEMNAAIPLLSSLMPYLTRSIVVKSEVPLCAIEVTTYGSSHEYNIDLHIVDKPNDKCPIAYPVTKALLEYAGRKINELRENYPKIRFAITGECAYYKFYHGEQADIDFYYPNADPTIPYVFDKPSHIVLLVSSDYPDKPGVAPIQWLQPAGAAPGVLGSNDTNKIKLMIDASDKILNGLGYLKRSDDFFFVTLDGGFPSVAKGEIPPTVQKQVGFTLDEQGAIKKGIHNLIYQFTRIFAKEQDLENPITLKSLGSTSQCKRYSGEAEQTNVINQINTAISTQLGLGKEDVQSLFIGPSMICISVRNLPENSTQHPKLADSFITDYQPCQADANIGNILRGIGIPVTTITHEPTITVTIQHLTRLRIKKDSFVSRVEQICDDFGFLLATKPIYDEIDDDPKCCGEISVDLIGKTTCVAFSTCISREFPVINSDIGVTMTINMTMAAMTTMRTLRELDPRLGAEPKINPIKQKAMRVPRGGIEAMKDLVKRNPGWKLDENYRILIFPSDDEANVKEKMAQSKEGNLDTTCFVGCGLDEPILLPQLIYANEKDGTVYPYAICKGCIKSIFENDECISTLFNPITHLIDQENIKTIEKRLSGFDLIDDNKDDETGLYWPMIPFGQVIWALLSDHNDELTPFVKAWFTIIVEFAIQHSQNFIFCPNHPAIPIPIPDKNQNVKCESCDMMFCHKCSIWHKMDDPCTGDDELAAMGIKRCPGCRLPTVKVSGCN